MPKPSATPDIRNRDNLESDPDKPSEPSSATVETPPRSLEEQSSDRPAVRDAGSSDSRYENDEAREASLRRELENVRNINQVMDGVVESLERAKGNMEARWSTGTHTATTLTHLCLDCLTHRK